jgi:hypothetical protein
LPAVACYSDGSTQRNLMPRKKPARYVKIDRGYGCNSIYETCRVVDERQYKGLFSEKLQTDLLVQLMGGERIWVSSWEEIPAKL